MPLTLKRLDNTDPQFEAQLAALLSGRHATGLDVSACVADIIATVRQQGDAALLEYTQRFDRLTVPHISQLEVSLESAQAALAELPKAQRHALEVAATRIRAYHQHQKLQSWQYTEPDGSKLGQQVTPLDRVGIYVPGGKASYPSSVLMNALPAKIAGVGEIIMTVPAPDGQLNPMVIAAAAIAGVDRIIKLGGAQAVAALAWGTSSIPAVDKIVGPGNCYVAEAKRQVFGHCGIDMVAGPSEVLIAADNSASPDWIAMDLMAQAEHDEQAQAILISCDQHVLDHVELSLQRLLPEQPRKAIIEQSLRNHGALIKAHTPEQMVTLINRFAPEHLELALADAPAWVPKIRHAGAIFVGCHSAESLGDYCAGPNHVLPTAATARFSSALGVYDFQKRTSVIELSAQGAAQQGKIAAILAEGEQLHAHAQSARYRTDPTP